MTPDQWNELKAVGKIIEKYFEIERYTDTDGIVWVGFGDAPNEIWVQELGSATHLTKTQMVRKMCHELWKR